MKNLWNKLKPDYQLKIRIAWPSPMIPVKKRIRPDHIRYLYVRFGFIYGTQHCIALVKISGITHMFLSK